MQKGVSSGRVHLFLSLNRGEIPRYRVEYVLLLLSLFDRSGVNFVASIAFGITETSRGSSVALRTVFSLLV